MSVISLIKRPLPTYLLPVFFIASLLTFILLKVPSLSLPFFWDEVGVYGQMAFNFADKGLSLHPDSVDKWFSRGHGLLYPNYIAVGLKLFGTNTTVAHVTNLTLTVCMLVTMYMQLAKKFAPIVGLMACIFLMAYPIFFTQSVFVLPEIALAYAVWMMTWAFIEKKYFTYVLAATASLFIKETAIVWILSLFLWQVMTERKLISSAKGLLLLPILPFIIFLFIQNQTFGWYLFPGHANTLDFRWTSVWDKLSFYVHYIFWEKGRFTISIILMTGIVFGMDSWGNGKDKNEKQTSSRIFVVCFSTLMYLLFSATTFHTQRYIITLLPYVCTGVAVSIFVLMNKNIMLSLGVSLLLFGLTMPLKMADRFNYDSDMYYVHSIESTKKVIHYMADHQMLNQNEFFANFPFRYTTTDPRFGYLPAGVPICLSINIGPSVKYAVQMIPGTSLDNPENYPLDTLTQWKDGDIRTIIFRVLPKD